MKIPQGWHAGWQSGLRLAGFAAIATFLLTLTYVLTQERSAANAEALRKARLAAVYPSEDLDIPLTARPLVLPPHPLLGQKTESTAYFAVRDGQWVGIVLEVIAPDGYSGAIRLLVGVNREGVIQGVRVLQHQETPGLGDAIEEQRSPWIFGFAGRSLANTRFAVAKDGGDFAQFTGATITPRAVVRAVYQALLYFDQEKESLRKRFEETYGQTRDYSERTVEQ